MLFNSYHFLFVFLPLALLGYWLSGKSKPIVSVLWLAVCSLAFYAYWNPPYLSLILLSILFNFAAGEVVGGERFSAPVRKAVFAGAVAVNLLVLGGFKYLGPSLDFLSETGLVPHAPHYDTMLPLGISFFTFTQIGYLVDRRDHVGDKLDIARYTVFVTFFPHLMSGPILHIREIGPQLKNALTYRLRAETFAPGLTMFVLGLAKKVLLADPLAYMAQHGYEHPEQLSFAFSWSIIVGYSLQLYFDFSGYSDMAIGLAGMFGFRFPLNFDSPYKARSVIEFWQRWHMTLTRYLGLLLYNPVAMWVARRRLAQGKKVSPKALEKPEAFVGMILFPTFYTMTLAGIWHGAGLQFLIFGLVHSSYLTINHGWRIYRKTRGVKPHKEETAATLVGKVALTYVAVILSLVLFRAESVSNAMAMFKSALGFHGLGIPLPFAGTLHQKFGLNLQGLARDWSLPDLLRILVSLVIVWCGPNTQQILGAAVPTLEAVSPGPWSWLRWRPSWLWAAIVALLLWSSLICFNQTTVFLYSHF